MKVIEYKMPIDLDEAYQLINSNKKAQLIAGGLFLRLQNRVIPLLVDLSMLQLDYIKENEATFEVGSMTTLRTIETSKLPNGIKESVKQIAGVGVRNLATIGGSICGRYPFSDINIALQALDCDLVFHKSGLVKVRDFIENGLQDQDILVKVIIQKDTPSYTKYYKKVYTDFSLVNVSVAGNDVVIGSRPGRGQVLENILDQDVSTIVGKVDFKDDYKASASYRKALASALLEDIKKEMEV